MLITVQLIWQMCMLIFVAMIMQLSLGCNPLTDPSLCSDQQNKQISSAWLLSFATVMAVLSQQSWGPLVQGLNLHVQPLRMITADGPPSSVSLPQACHTGMRSYIYNKNSLIGSQAEHCGMRTYYFSADTQEDMNGWIRAMNQAALMQSHGMKRSVTSRCCCKSSLTAGV